MEDLKTMVREKYAQIAEQDKATNEASCCGATCCAPTDGTYTIMSDSYEKLNGYVAEADLGLGCGLPTEFARIRPGDVVLDLGSGAGNDCFVARAETGASGKVIGVDFTPAMIRRARENSERRGFHNVEFRQGDIEDLPVSDASVDVVVSNCVLNLVPNKAKVFAEIMRVLRPGGHFSISDIVLVGELPEPLVRSAEMYAGCVAGAMQMGDYLGLAQKTGFENLTVQKQKPILIPDEILLQHLSAAELEVFKTGKTGIFSITVFAKKSAGEVGQKAKIQLAHLQKTAAQPAVAAAAPCCDSGCCK